MKKNLLFSAFILMTLFTACTKEAVEEGVLPTSRDKASAQVLEGNLDRNIAASPAMMTDFSIDNINGTVDELKDLLLSNKTVNAVSYEWNFGNGDKSTQANPSYKYKIHGRYTVTLKTTDARGNVKQASHEVVVLCVFGGGSHDE